MKAAIFVNKMIIPVIYYEIVMFLFLLIGFIGFFISALICCRYVFVMFTVVSFMALFVVLSFACGFARLRLPVEPFLIIISSKFWVDLFKTKLRKTF